MISLKRLTILISALIIGVITLVQLCWGAECSLKDKSFSIRSKVVVTPNSLEPMRESLLEESYSQEQRRAKIKYTVLEQTGSRRRQGRYAAGLFYFDSIRSMSVVLNDASFRSSLETVDELNGIIGLNKLDIYDDESYADDFIVGPARLLFFLSKHRDKQQLVEMTNVIFVFNVHCLKYILNHTTKAGERIRFTIYYSELALATDAQSLPMQVIMEFLDASRDLSNIIISYALDTSISTFGIVPDSNSHHNIQLDWFTLEPLVGFSSVLLTSHGEDLFADRPYYATKFSFTATVERADGTTNTRFVAYDGRLDTLVQHPKKPQTDVSGLSQMLFNFKLNRMYHIVTRKPDSASLVDKVLHLARKNSPDNVDGISDDSQCIVSKILPNLDMGSTTRPLTIGRMLVGASKFVYLGRATVRGVPALVYEASGADSPFWLDHRLVYKVAKSGGATFGYTESERSLYHSMTEPFNSTSTSSLLYVVDSSVYGPTLLMLEIYRWNLKTTDIYDKQTVHFYNFRWELNYDEDPASLFSLQDLCSSGLGRNQYALVKLLLEKNGPSLNDNPDSQTQSNTFASQIGTNLALMGSLQANLKLPATMIYDLSWHSIEGASKAKTNDKDLLLATSFRVAEHVDNLVEQIYLGQGLLNISKRKQSKGFYTLHKVRTVAGCFFLASHRRASVYFAFEPTLRQCYIDFDTIQGDATDFPPHFVDSPEGNMEVYRVDHIDKAKSNSWLQDIYQTASEFYTHQASLIGTRMSLIDVTPDHGSIEFIIKHAEMDERNFRTSSASKDSKNEQEILTDRMEGFGLVATGELSQRVGPTPMNVNHWNLINSKDEDQSTAMSREQCEAACLSDTTCHSYSICIEDSELKCVISKASFKSSDIIDRLKQISRDKKSSAGLNRIVQVKLDDGQIIELVKHPNCDLNNVLYSSYFFKPRVVLNTFTNRYIYSVRDQEDCAEICLERNIEILRGDIEHQKVSAQFIFDPDSSSANDHGKLQSLLSEHRRVAKQICRTFFYIDKVRMLSFPKDLADRIQDSVISHVLNGSNDNLIGLTNQDNGFCVMVDPKRKDDEQTIDQSSSKANEYINLDMYSFRFDLFYEKQYGVRLLGTKMDGLELEAQKLATTDSREITEEHFSVLKTFVQSGKNSQDMIQATASKCATVCFLQTWGPWPACRSFDIVIENLNRTAFTKCYLNSITLKQAITTQRLDLIDDSIELQAWHYEPRSGFVLDESNLDGNLKLIEISPSLSNSSKFKHNLIIYLLISLVAIAGGLFAGLLASKAYLIRQSSITQTDHDVLVLNE